MSETPEGVVVENENGVPKISAATITRIVLLALALINTILEMTGHSIIPISNEQITEAISLAFTIFASLYAAWKDNDITANARMKKASIEAKETETVVE